jgi:segregation and condensation protein A
MKAMKNIMARTAILNPYSTQVTIKEVSVEDRIEVIKSRLEYRYDTISFEELCSDCFNVRLVVVTFLAILDLIHTRWLDFSVDENHIWVRRVRNDESN